MVLGQIPQAVEAWLEAGGHGEPAALEPVGGGCINHGSRLRTASGSVFFLKTNPHAPADLFVREAEGLEALCVKDGPRVPRAHCQGPGFILMEDLEPARPANDYWSRFGRELAALHNHTAECFGFAHDNYIGSTPQPNPWTEDGFDFFAHQRLMFQAKLAQRQGYLSAGEAALLERLASRLRAWVPPQPASLLHGDLWSGNAICDAKGNPAIIDPAVHYGWAEAELGMTTLFGTFPETFYRAYEEIRPLEAGWRERMELYNLYHLLNHLNLFGGSYYGSVMGSIKRFIK